MDYLDRFKAREGFVLVHKTDHLYGEVVYSTEEFPYTIDDFNEVPKEGLEKIIQGWRLNNANSHITK